MRERERERERERGNGFAQRHRGNRGGGTSPPLHREKNTSWYNIELLRTNWFMVTSNSRFWTGDGGSDGRGERVRTETQRKEYELV